MNDYHKEGIKAENISGKYNIIREEQDIFVANNQKNQTSSYGAVDTKVIGIG